MGKNGNIPQLRFNKFFHDWTQRRMDEIAPLQRGFDLPTTEVIVGNYPVVYSNGILRKHSSYKSKAPGLVTGRSGTIGKLTFVEEDYWPHNTSLWVTDFKDHLAITLQTVPPISLHTVPVISLQTVPLSIMNNIVLALLKKQYQHGRKQKKHYGYQTSITTQTKRI